MSSSECFETPSSSSPPPPEATGDISRYCGYIKLERIVMERLGRCEGKTDKDSVG